MTQEFQHDDVIPHGEEIVERFGGIRPMASKLNIPVTTVQGWKKRDAIPAIRRDEILNAALHYNIDLKGVISADVANQNSTIAEDPALLNAPLLNAPLNNAPNAGPAQAAAPRPAQPGAGAGSAPASPAQRSAQNPSTHQFSTPDMRDVKRTARRTSAITTLCLLALVGGAGAVLFGNTQTPDNALDARVTALETRPAVSGDGSGDGSSTVASLQQQVSNITALIGASSDTLAQMARDVAAGSGATLTQRLGVLEQQLTRNAGAGAPALAGMIDRAQDMAASAAGSGEWQAAISDLKSVVGGLNGRMDGLDSALAEAKTQNDALGRTLADVSGRDLSAAAMLLALTQLRQAADRQTPFTDDLELLRNLAAGTDPELAASVERMAPYAENGILSPQALKRELQGSANDIITAKLKGEDVSFKDKIMSRLQGLFSIRKDGASVVANAENEAIARASAQLDEGDVQGAMATLNTLNGPAREAVAPWQSKAAATVAAQALDGQLVTSIMNKIKSAAGQMSGSSLTGVINAGPINMAPQAAAPVTQAEPQPAMPQNAEPAAPPVLIEQ